MFGYKRVAVACHERGLLFRDRNLVAILGPGLYRWFDPLGRITVELGDLRQPELRLAQAEILVLLAPKVCADALQRVEIGEHEVGLVHVDGHLQGLIPPAGRRVFWKEPRAVRIERLEIAGQLRIPEAVIHRLLRLDLGEARPFLQAREIPSRHLGLLFVDGRLTGTLEPGLHGFWAFHHSVRIEILDLRRQAMEVSGQEILTKDKVSLRLNLAAGFEIADPVKVSETLEDWKAELYRELQFGLRQAVGLRTLDQLLEDKDSLGQGIRDQVAARVAPYGLAVKEVGVKDVILPGEMKTILNQVVEAEKLAQANLIKRREETAATRSLLNTARLMEQNPLLLRLKELESLEKVTERIDRLTVFGGLEGVLADLIRIGGRSDDRPSRPSRPLPDPDS